MPLFYKSHTFPKLRKSEKSKSTDILFDVNKKELKMLNYQNIQSYYTVELLEYPKTSKVLIIKFIKKITNLSVKEIQSLIETTPNVILREVQKKDVVKIELGLLMLGARTRIT